jgi:putative intracellular protease/amidase
LLNFYRKCKIKENISAQFVTHPKYYKKQALLKTGLLYATICHHSVKYKFDTFIDHRVVIDGKLVISQSPGTSMELALKLVEILFGVDRMKKVNARVLVQI